MAMLRFAFLLVLGAVALQEASSQKIGRRAGKAEALIEQRFDRKQLERELEDLDLEPVTRRPRLLRPLRPHNFVAASSESGTAQRLDPAAAVSPAGEGQKGFLGYPIETYPDRVLRGRIRAHVHHRNVLFPQAHDGNH